MKAILFLVLVSVVLIYGEITIRSKCPPDSKQQNPLIVPEEGLPFCSEYKEESCCSAKDTLAIRNTVLDLMRPECPSCFALVSQWKCAECHPNAAIFYEGSCATTLRLCDDYCLAMFEVCKDIPFDIDSPDGAFYLNEGGVTAESFCSKATAPEPHCFRGDTPGGIDEHCKCPNHQCHLDRNFPRKPEQKKVEL